MSTTDWNKLAEKAGDLTDNELKKELTGLTSLNITEIDSFIKESNITNTNALKLLKEINDATVSNNEKVKTIGAIETGVGFLLQLVSKVV